MNNYDINSREPYKNSGIISDAIDGFNTTFANDDSNWNHLKQSTDTFRQQNLTLNTTSEEELNAQKEAVKSAIANAWSKMWEQKRARLKNAMNDRTQITLKAIMDEVAPYTLAFANGKGSSMAIAIANKIDDFVNYLLGITDGTDSDDTWLGQQKKGIEEKRREARKEGKDFNSTSIGWLGAGSVATSIMGNTGMEIMNQLSKDPAVMESISQLNSIKQLAVHINYMASAVNDIKEILQYLEPLKPLANILIDYAMAPATGGASIQRANDTLWERTNFLCQQLICDAIENLREFIFNIRISVPSIMVESFKTLDISENFDEERAEIKDWIKNFGRSGSEDADESSVVSFLNKVINGNPLEAPDWDKLKINTEIDENNENGNGGDFVNKTTRQYTPDYLGSFPGYISNTADNLKNDFIAEHPTLAEEITRPNIFTTLFKGSLTMFLEPAVREARKNANIPALEDPIWKENYNKYYDESLFESNEDNTLTDLDQALLRNPIPSVYFDEETIRILSGKILTE